MLTSADRPTAEGVLGVVRDALALVLEIDATQVTTVSVLVELEADSLALVEVAEIVEERLAPYATAPFVIPDTDLESLATVGQVVDYVLARL